MTRRPRRCRPHVPREAEGLLVPAHVAGVEQVPPRDQELGHEVTRGEGEEAQLQASVAAATGVCSWGYRRL